MRLAGRALSQVGIRPMHGSVPTSYAVAYWDFKDKVRTGVDETDLDDRSQNYFSIGTQVRPALALAGSVGSAWDTASGAFDFDGATHRFFIARSDAAAYKPALDIQNDQCALMWARVNMDSMAANGCVLNNGNRNATSPGWRWEWSNALSRFRIRLNNGVSEFFTNDSSGVTYSTGVWYDLAVYLDLRPGYKQVVFFTNSIVGQLRTVSGTVAYSDDSVHQEIAIGANKQGTAAAQFFNGRIQGVGCINFGSTPPNNIWDIVRRLARRKSVPGWEFRS